METLTATSAPGKPINGKPPVYPSPEFTKVPDRLVNLSRWVFWYPKWVLDKQGNGKWTKVPVSPNSHLNFTRKAEECVTLEQARKIYAIHGKRKGWAGIGLSLHGGEGLVALDFDDCLEGGKFKSDELKNLIFSLGSYTETSPSGNGLRVFVNTRSNWLFNISHQPDKETKEPHPLAKRYGCRAVEAWSEGKYATVTGLVFSPELSQVRENSAILETFIAEMGETFSVKAEETSPAPAKDISKLPKLTEEQVREALKTLDPDCRVEDWVTLGYAVHDWDSGETGLRVWDDWSRGGSKYQADYSKGKPETEIRWKGFQQGGKTTIGTLIAKAREKGWKAPLEGEGERLYNQAKANSPTPEAPVELPDKFPASDTGNAERLLQSPDGGRMRYFVDAGYWIYFNGKKWVVDTEGVRCQRLALNSIRKASSLVPKAYPSKDSRERKDAEAFFLRSESAFALKACVQVAKTLPGFQIEDHDQLDADPSLLNTPNGVVNLRECRLEAHRPELMMTKATKYSVSFDEGCPTWEALIREWMCGDESLVEALELITGASVTGYTPELMAIFYGSESGNGKSTVTETIRELLGEYAGGIGSKALVADHRYSTGDSATPSIAGLQGKRLVLPDEWKEDDRLDEATLKRICSQDAITARMLHANPITFRPSHTVILRTNHLPKVSADDAGAWRRIYPFPWNFTIPDDKKDEGLRRRLLKDEGRQILGWLCRCAMKFIALHDSGKPIPKPKSVVELKQKYRSESDVIAQWAEAEVEFGEFPPYFISTKTLRDSLESFAEERGEEAKAISHRQFSNYLINHGCCPTKKRGERGYKGLRLKVPADGEGESPDGVEMWR